MRDPQSGAAAFTAALGAEIAYWRKRRAMTRSELATAACFSASTMGRIEREGPKDVADTWRLAQALGVPLSTLVERAE
ncbi:helix-turn-helix domain-containing protein [Nocardioides sp.]|uniref:helix-turn-helix domain-containing protein n=1 Tax=Nocardioides sp. TaxID=35761 RepID=UPI003782F1B5